MLYINNETCRILLSEMKEYKESVSTTKCYTNLVIGHKVARTGNRALFPQPGDLARVVDFVVFKHSEFFLLSLVLVLFRSGVLLLLALFSTT